MASFVEQAVLKITDDSTGPIRKINSELKKLMATAKSFGSTKIDFGLNTKGLSKAEAAIKRLSSEINQLKSARINVTVNTSAAQQAVNRLRSQAGKPVAVATQAARTAHQPGGLGRGGGGAGPVLIRGVVDIGAGSLMALGRHLLDATKEGYKATDIGDSAIALKHYSEQQHMRQVPLVREARRGHQRQAGSIRIGVDTSNAKTGGATPDTGSQKAGGAD